MGMVSFQPSPIGKVSLLRRAPIVDGWKVAEQIAEAPLLKRPFIIAISGHSGDVSKERGIYMHMLKPVDPAQLLHILERFEALAV